MLLDLPSYDHDDASDSGEACEAPPVLLRGTRAGLEILVSGEASLDEVAVALEARLEGAPGFFAGNDVAVRVDGRLPAGALARLEQVTGRFGLRITEIGPARTEDTARPVPADPDRAARPPVALVAPAVDVEAALDSLPDLTVVDERAVEPTPVASYPPASGPRLLIGPLRSGAVIEAAADLVIVGDVNPGAEISARGNIIVLGRLRGVAHAAVGGERGFIFALRLEPQQIRIGRLVARAGEADAARAGAEIAYATGKTIVVERYQGRLPAGLDAAA